MFKKTERMSKREFDEVFRTGRRHHFPHLTIITEHSKERNVAVVVGKKVSRSAVRRNTLRRRVYAILRLSLDEMAYVDAMIIILKPTFNSLTRTTAEDFVRTSIEQVLKTP